MTSIIETECPECDKVFSFDKWDSEYQAYEEVECPKCGCIFNERSKEVSVSWMFPTVSCNKCNKPFMILRDYSGVVTCPYCGEYVEG